MSYKEVLKDKIKAMLSHNTHRTHKDIMSESLQIVYNQALRESKQTGQSVSSITYEILEALEEYQDKQNENIDEQLTYASTIIVNIIYKDAQKRIEEKEKNLSYAHTALIHTMEQEILHLLESFDTLSDYANDQSHLHFKKSLSHIKSDIIHKVDEFKVLLAHYTH